MSSSYSLTNKRRKFNGIVIPFTLTTRDTSCTYVTEQVDTHIHDNDNGKRKLTRDALNLLE